ncbi:GNAT family N-acetyltransferase [Lederbergia lenta]|uniref:GNAT family N-acetyltransferase n=1 Tax=Lederbergia lenta TaxID=1467 RepID=UPI00203B2978|nr:GNAT family protein [Lederbergia lenta]MCM3109576.1 GNAT family N-acetyltransferase [Lederbergia lenta]
MARKISTERLYLREIKEDDWFAVHKYASQSVVCQYQPWGPNTENESKRFVQQIIADANKDIRTRFVFAIIEKETERMIGSSELKVKDTINRSGAIAYIVNPDYWGKGIATEVAKLLIHIGFKDFHLHRIYAMCDSRNIASSKVLEKVGMTKEGYMRENLFIKDGWRDSLLYSILDREYSQYSK